MKEKKFKIEYWPLDKIKPYFRNAKLHHVDRIAASIRDFKIDQPIVVDADGVIIKGHGRLKAAEQLGLKNFPVVVRTDLTDEQVRASRIADNVSAEGGWDTELLQSELSDLDFDGLQDYGIDEDWLNDLGVLQQDEQQTDDEAQPPDDFKEYDEDIETEYCCPKCQYKWSGKPK